MTKEKVLEVQDANGEKVIGSQSAPKDGKPAVIEEIIDYRTLQTVLRMDVRKEELGYHEKKFNTCQVGSGYSSTQNCRSM